jgi:integrase
MVQLLRSFWTTNTDLRNVSRRRRLTGRVSEPFEFLWYGARNVPLTGSLVEILKRRLAKAKGPYLFPHRDNPNKFLTSLKKAHEEALRKAEIKSRFRIYDLRHTLGSRTAMAVVDLATLKELMGHSQISMTMRYVHPTPEHKRQAVQKLEEFNVEQVFALYENREGGPHKSPHSGESATRSGLLND